MPAINADTAPIVLRHEVNRFDRSAFRYGGEANLQLREMRGRDGFRCQVRPDDGAESFWINAEHLEVLP